MTCKNDFIISCTTMKFYHLKTKINQLKITLSGWYIYIYIYIYKKNNVCSFLYGRAAPDSLYRVHIYSDHRRSVIGFEPCLMQTRFYYLLRQKIMVFYFQYSWIYWNYCFHFNIIVESPYTSKILSYIQNIEIFISKILNILCQ